MSTRVATEEIRFHVVDAERHVISHELAIVRLAADRAADQLGADFDPVHDVPWLEGDDLVVPRASVPSILEVLEEADLTWFVGRVPGMLTFLADRIRSDAVARGWPTRSARVPASDAELPVWPGARWAVPSMGT